MYTTMASSGTTTLLYDGMNGSVMYDIEHGNNTSLYTYRKSLDLEILWGIYLVAQPIICTTGFITNLLAVFVFMSKPLRRTSCSWYLTARSVSDGGFLFATFFTWASDASKLMFFHTEGVCQVMPFVTYLFGFLSVWLTVVVTMENYIRICRPFSVQRYCTVVLARRVIICLFIIGIILYHYPLWTSKVFPHTNNNITTYHCAQDKHFGTLLKWLSIWDMFITFVVPSLLIIVLMVAITFSLIKSLKRQSRLQSGTSRAARENTQTAGSARSCRSSSSPQAKVTRMLFAVSFFFILLNGPFHIIRMKMAVVEFTRDAADYGMPTEEQKAQVVLQIIYYSSFAVNLIIYLVFGNNFRKQFKETYFSPCVTHRSPPGCSEMTAMSVVRLEEIDHPQENAALIENGAPSGNNNGSTNGSANKPT